MRRTSCVPGVGTVRVGAAIYLYSSISTDLLAFFYDNELGIIQYDISMIYMNHTLGQFEMQAPPPD